jgi:glycosyltransferase involved in cell wall biosynthesis
MTEKSAELRVLHISPSYYPAVEYGGPVRSLYELCLAQRRAGLDVRVLTSTASGRESFSARQLLGRGAAGPLGRFAGRWVEEFGVPTYYAGVRLPPDIAPAMVAELRPLLRWAELVHVTGVFSAASVLGMATTLSPRMGGGRRPVIVSPRGALLPWALGQGRSRLRKQAFLQLLAPLLRRVRGWHVTSEQEAEALQEIVGRSGALIQVAAPGVSLGAGGDVPIVRARGASSQLLALGRIHPVKNLELALDALALLRCEHTSRGKDGNPPTLVIAGPVADPNYAAELKARVAALGLDGAVRWAGLVTGEAKQLLLADSAALWLCSHMESFGNVVVEALAAGTPVVATTTTPWALLPQAGVGHLVPPDPAAIAAATGELLQQTLDPARRQELATRCRQLAQDRFSWEAAERRLRQLYLSAIGPQLSVL